MREIHYTFSLRLHEEDEEFEGEFEDGLSHILETAGDIEDHPEFALDLHKKVVA